MRRATLNSGELLQRKVQASPTREERDSGRIANLIVIGASTGGHRALMDILKDFSADTPAAIGILLHMPLGNAHSVHSNLVTEADAATQQLRLNLADRGPYSHLFCA